jgi:predicted naringenin-chalcone synthase
MSVISAIGISVPEFRFSQSAIGTFMEKMMGPDQAVIRKVRTVFRASGIQYRQSVLTDYGKTSDFTFYPNHEGQPFPDTKRRMQLYREKALPLSLSAVHDLTERYQHVDVSGVTHLVVVSCTGMYAPGLDIDLVKHLKLSPSIERTCVQFMGCYAAFNGIKIADTVCKSRPDAKVLIVCTELCSIHFQPEPTEDNILSNALFGDGACAIYVEASTEAKKKLHIVRSHSQLAFKGEAHMAWEISNTGFEMKLSSYVPDLIKGEIRPLIQTLLGTLGPIESIKYFALHPGGKKILAILETELGISREHIREAYAVLANYGNMSSATVVFVLDKIFSALSNADDDHLCLALGFGPGLTLESMLFKIEIS